MNRIIPETLLHSNHFRNLLQRMAPTDGLGLSGGSSSSNHCISPLPPLVTAKNCCPLPAPAPAPAPPPTTVPVPRPEKKGWLPTWFDWKFKVLVVLLVIMAYILVGRIKMLGHLGVWYVVASRLPFLSGICASAAGVTVDELRGEIDAYLRGMHPAQNPAIYQSNPPPTIHPPSPTVTIDESKNEEHSPPPEVQAEEEETPAKEPEPEPEVEPEPEPEPEVEQEPSEKETVPPEILRDPDFDDEGEPITRQGVIKVLLEESLATAEFEREEAWEKERRKEEEAIRLQEERERENQLRLERLQKERLLQQQQQQEQPEKPVAPPPATSPVADEVRLIADQHQRVLNAIAEDLL